MGRNFVPTQKEADIVRDRLRQSDLESAYSSYKFYKNPFSINYIGAPVLVFLFFLTDGISSALLCSSVTYDVMLITGFVTFQTAKNHLKVNGYDPSKIEKQLINLAGAGTKSAQLDPIEGHVQLLIAQGYAEETARSYAQQNAAQLGLPLALHE